MTNGNDSIHNSEQGPQDGLTKREYFAAMAMQGLLLNGAWDKGLQEQCERVGSNTSTAISVYAVDLADELINQLNKQ